MRLAVKATPGPFVSLPAVTEPQRVLFAYRDDVDTRGGAAGVMNRTAEALEALGVQTEVTHDVEPDVTGFDIVHAVNVWAPNSALQQLRHLRAAGATVVWQPFYLGYSELSWAMRALPAVFDPGRPAVERDQLVAAFTAGAIEAGGITRYGKNEPMPGFHQAAAEMVGLADRIVVCSMHEAQLLSQDVGLRGTPFTHTPHGVQADRFARASGSAFRSYAGLGDEPFALCVGAIDLRKNQMMLAHALRDSGFPLVLLGPAIEPGTLDLVRAAGGDNLVHIDRVDAELVASAYHAASVHVLPSWAEGAALANLEAASAGCPIVVSDRSSEFEYFGELARYCDPADPGSIRDVVEGAMDARVQDTDRYAELKRRMAGLTWENTARATVRAYAAALRDARERGRRIDGARSFTTLVRAGEILSDPQLLRAYGEHFSGADDATLVIYAPHVDQAELEQQLVETAAAAGMDGEGSADMLALPFARRHPDEEALAAGIDAVLSPDPPRGAFARVPHFDHATLTELRAAAERAWSH